MQFINLYLMSPLVIGAVVALPILIHLINLMRYRRVEWAAMEFLLASYKKRSTWILLKQLLLLLLRILALLALLFIVAQLLYDTDISKWLSGVTTHHVVLVDDTYSMSDKSADETALDVAKQQAEDIGDLASRSSGRHKFTLVRFSRAKDPDLKMVTVDSNLGGILRSQLGGMRVTQTSVSPQEAIDAALKSLTKEPDEKRVVYILSDCRKREWEVPDDLNERFARMAADGAEINITPCVSAEHANLTVTSLKPLPGTLASGVDIFMDVSVKNHGKETQRDVTVMLLKDDSTLSPLVIDEIPPGRVETRRFQVQFETAGKHRVTASLESDVVEADNTRHSLLEIHAGIPVLVIDGAVEEGEVESADGRFIQYALNPNPELLQTGINPQLESPRFLNSNRDNLHKYQAIYLCNFPRLDEAAVEALEEYVAAGGGVAMFVGERINPKFINEKLYRDGKGLFPVPLAADVDLIVDRLEKAPDLAPETDHPVFRVFAGQRNSFLAETSLWRYYALPRDWAPEEGSTTKVICHLRNNAPLVIERTHESGGRVVAFLTTAGPIWNNWSRNPSYVVAMLQMQTYLASSRWVDESRPVNSELAATLSLEDYQSFVRLESPSENATANLQPVDGEYHVSFPDTTRSGVYELHLTNRSGEKEIRKFVLNVDPDEGDLELLGPDKLGQLYPKTKLVSPGSIASQVDNTTRSNFSELLLYGLIFLLLCEQMLAYSASYHPPSLKGMRA